MHQPLIGERAVLDPVLVFDLPRPHLEAAAAEFVEAAEAGDRVRVGPLFALQLLQPGQRRRGGTEARLQLLVLLDVAIAFDPEQADQKGSVSPWPTRVTRITLEGDEEDQVAAGKRPSPASVVSGSASAAASETAPRIPAQQPMIRGRQPKAGELSLRGPAVEAPDQHPLVPKVQAKRKRDHPPMLTNAA